MHVEDNGLYRASDGEHVALVNVGPENPLEFQEVVSTTEKLRPLAEATGGSSKRLGDPAAVPRILAMRESPIYAGAGLHRDQTHRRERADRRLALAAGRGFWRAGRAVGALVVMWLAEGGRRFWPGGAEEREASCPALCRASSASVRTLCLGGFSSRHGVS